VGLVKIHLFRPFPFDAVRGALRGVPKAAVIDRNVSFGHGGIVASEIRAALASQSTMPQLFSYIGGLGGRDITPATIDDVIANTMARAEPLADTLWVGLKE
jgi:pyruvate/2-oxoacid:ferredoxin oxidoreductase alpha subunit